MDKQTQVTETASETPTVTERSYSYILTTRDGEQRIEDRDEAIRLAKAATLDNLQSATVEREDGRVTMQFHQGGLVDYVYETRKVRKKTA